MPKTSEMHNEGKYLKKEDVDKPLLVTVKGLTRNNLAAEGEEDDYKWCLLFHELPKPLALNQTNITLCEEAFQSDDTDHWIGKRLVLYTDPSVMFGGKRVGGIRVRAPKANAVLPAPPPQALTSDDIPF